MPTSLPAKLFHWTTRLLTVFGGLTLVLCLWLMSGRSTILERLATESQSAAPAQAIIVLGGGMAGHALPTDSGWERVYTAVQLQADGLAPVIVFSGGGTEKVSEAEVYAEAARWLGCPPDAIVLDPFPGSTAEHPGNLLKLGPGPLPVPLARDTPLLVVTSRLHSRRAAMCFRKSGFTCFRVVTSYEATKAPVARGQLKSAVPNYAPNNKSYADPVNRLRWGLNDTLIALRELAGLVVYRWQGKA